MLLLLEIGMLIAGIVALIRGEFNLTRTKVVRGAVARIIGAMLLAPLLLALSVGIVVTAIHDAKGGQPDDPGLRTTLGLIEGGLIVLFFVAAIVVAAIYGETPSRKKRKRRYAEDEEDDDDRPRRRRRPRDEDDDEEIPPRRAARNEDDEDRPRRRPDDRIRD